MTYPKSEDKKIQKLSNLMTKYAETQGVEFSFEGEQIYTMEAFSHFGCLSLFLAEAKELYEKVYNNLYTVEELMSEINKGKKTKKLSLEDSLKEQEYLSSQPKDKIFPINFIEKTEDTYFGFIPKTSENIPADFFILSHVALYTLDEYLKIYKKNKLLLVEGKVPLDPLYEKLVSKVNSRAINVISSTTPTVGVSFTNDVG